MVDDVVKSALDLLTLPVPAGGTLVSYLQHSELVEVSNLLIVAADLPLLGQTLGLTTELTSVLRGAGLRLQHFRSKRTLNNLMSSPHMTRADDQFLALTGVHQEAPNVDTTIKHPCVMLMRTRKHTRCPCTWHSRCCALGLAGWSGAAVTVTSWWPTRL